VGHSDALIGTATANERAWPLLQAGGHDFGQIAAPDDVFLALRGMRSMAVRLKQHWENGVLLAESLVEEPLVERVLHPALPQDAGYALWKRDYLGATGLFAVALRPVGKRALSAFFQHLRLFGIGLSWGGFESLALPSEPTLPRAVKPVPYGGPIIRIHAGLESAADLIDDMRGAFRHMHSAL
jgi:cysteine-S-conjugate beta-lyase